MIEPIAMYADHESCAGKGCFVCDNSGLICNVCGEPPTVCSCPTGDDAGDHAAQAAAHPEGLAGVLREDAATSSPPNTPRRA